MENAATGSAHDAAQANFTLGYMTCPQDASKSYVGALLVTDSVTRPLHFAYVSPVKPTTMQRILYGRTLDEHVRIEVIARKLLTKAIPVVPDVLFVDDAALLEARRVMGWPTAHLAKNSGPGLASVSYDTGQVTSDDALVASVVTALEASVDLLNPFDRLREALKEALKAEQN